MSLGDAANEGRVNRRRRTIKTGRIWFNDDQSVMDCQVRDLSTTGAKIRFVQEFACPAQVKLQLPDGEQEGIFLRAERVWLREREVGLRFTDGDKYEGVTVSY